MEGVIRGRGRGIGRGRFIVSEGPNVAYKSTCGRGFATESPCRPGKPVLSGREEIISIAEKQTSDPAGGPSSDLDTKAQNVGKSAIDFEKFQGINQPLSLGRGKPDPEKIVRMDPQQIKPKSIGRGSVVDKQLTDGQTVTEAKAQFEKGLSNLVNTEDDCIIRLALTYFHHADDVQFFVDRLFHHFLKTPDMVLYFAMHAKLLTSFKVHGEQIKCKIFLKLQAMYQQMPSLEEISGLDERKKQEIANFCFLMGQMYFRFRPFLDSPDRYHVLAGPSAHCMIILLHLRGSLALIGLNKLLNVNLKALRHEAQDKIDELCLDLHKAFVDGKIEEADRIWILCALDHMMCGERGKNFPHNLSEFYKKIISSEYWDIMSREYHAVQLLAEIPTMTSQDMARFDVDVTKYNSSVYVNL